MSERRSFAEKLRRRFPTPGHYLLFIRIAAWSLLLRPLIRILSLPKLMRVFTPAGPAAGDDHAIRDAELIDFYVRVVLRLNPANTGRMCLKRSLLLFRFLRLRGIPARFCVGVRPLGENLDGHAWVEIDGRHFSDNLEGVPFSITFSHPDGLK